MFLENLMMAAKQVSILYVLVAIGFICDKTGLYKEKAARMTNDLLFYIITPAVIIQAFMSVDGTKENIKKLLICVGLGAILQIIGGIAAAVFFRDKTDENNSIYKFGSAYGNVGYMALPLAGAILGAEGVFYCSAIVMVFNVCSFTHGIYIMNGSSSKFDWKKLIINPGTIAVIIGMPLFLLGVELPEIVSKPLDYVASLNTPLAMIIFGTYLSGTDLRTIFADRKIYRVALIKLIILPIAMLGVFKLFGISETMLIALTISSSAPSANNTVMFSAKYDKDVGTASKLIALVSFLSIITMPFMIALGQYLC